MALVLTKSIHGSITFNSNNKHECSLPAYISLVIAMNDVSTKDVCTA